MTPLRPAPPTSSSTRLGRFARARVSVALALVLVVVCAGVVWSQSNETPPVPKPRIVGGPHGVEETGTSPPAPGPAMAHSAATGAGAPPPWRLTLGVDHRGGCSQSFEVNQYEGSLTLRPTTASTMELEIAWVSRNLFGGWDDPTPAQHRWERHRQRLRATDITTTPQGERWTFEPVEAHAWSLSGPPARGGDATERSSKRESSLTLTCAHAPSPMATVSTEPSEEILRCVVAPTASDLEFFEDPMLFYFLITNQDVLYFHRGSPLMGVTRTLAHTPKGTTWAWGDDPNIL